MSCKGEYKLYDANGRWIIGGSIHLPDQLDWMSIDVKAHWFCWMGQGSEKTHYVLLSSQGEQRLIKDVSLKPLDYKTYKERLENSYGEIDRFIDEGGYSREPRNQ